MASIETETAEVVALTYPDYGRAIFDTANVLHYQRIAELYLSDGYFGRSVKLPRTEEGPRIERSLELPINLAERLMDTAQHMHDYGHYNCHRFSRAMISADLACGANAHEPITHSFWDRPRVNSLPVGAIGLVGVSGYGVPHSLVGIGEESLESLQVISAEGQLAIATNANVLGWYSRFYNDHDAHLYRAPNLTA
jgi:hypothetical protein